METNDTTVQPEPMLDELAKARAKRLAALDAAPALSPADILRKRTVDTEWVLVPELGGKVLVRALTATERDAFEASLVVMRGKERSMSTANVRAKLCALAIVDPTYFPEKIQRAFTDEQIVELGAVSAGAMSRIYDAAAKLSGISEADVEELAGNSNPVASAGSSSKSL